MALSAIKGLKLAPLPAGHKFPPAKAGSAMGFVDAGSMVSFTSELSDVHKSDVLNSTLLAQLASDARYDRRTDTDNWYKFYINVLNLLGWNIQDVQFQEYNTADKTLQLSEVILEIVAEILTEAELAYVRRTIDSLNTSGNDPWWTVYDGKSCNTSQYGNFQVAPCKVDSSGMVVMSLASFYFTITLTHPRWKWANYPAYTVRLFKRTQVATLDENLYEQVRQEVIDRLGDNIKAYIGDLDI